MRSVPSAIKWCVCITIRPAGDIYSPTRAHTRAPCMKDRGTARTTRRRLNVSVRACWRSSTRARMKVNNSSCQNPLSSKAKQVNIIEHCNECRFQPSMAPQLLRLGRIGLRMSFSNTPLVLPWPLQNGLELATRALLDPGDQSSVDSHDRPASRH
jgi:hypothetical protein